MSATKRLVKKCSKNGVQAKNNKKVSVNTKKAAKPGLSAITSTKEELIIGIKQRPVKLES